MPVLLVPWASGPRDSRGGLGCRSQARLLGRNGEGLGRRACDEHLGGQGPSEFGWWQQRGGQAGGCGLRSPRARNIYRARTRDRCALFRARAARSVAPCAGPVGRARQLVAHGCAMPCPRAMPHVPRNCMLLPLRGRQCSEVCCLLPAAGCRPRAGDGRDRDPHSCCHGSAASVHIPPVFAKNERTPHVLRGASPRALSADPGLMPLRGSCGGSQLRRALSSAHCGHLDGLRRSTEARAKRVSQTQPRGAAAPRETGGQFRPKHRRVHRCRDRPRRLGGHHASAVDGARVTTGGGGALGQRRGD